MIYQNSIINFFAFFIPVREIRERFINRYTRKTKYAKIREDLNKILTTFNNRFPANRNLSITYSLALAAHKETIDYIKKNIDMSSVVLFNNRFEHLLHCARKAPSSGLFIECGVRHGDTINRLAAAFMDKEIHGFDSFEGLPDDGAGTVWKKGDFNMKKVLPTVKHNVILHRGWFNPVLGDFLAKRNEKIALLHVDCDIYPSAVDILICVEKYIQPGTIIVFDEMWNFPNWQNHEFKAFHEFIDRTKCKYRFISINASQQCGIEIVDKGNIAEH